MTVSTLQFIRSDDKFDFFWEVVSKSAAGLEPKLPRHRKRPRRYVIFLIQLKIITDKSILKY